MSNYERSFLPIEESNSALDSAHEMAPLPPPSSDRSMATPDSTQDSAREWLPSAAVAATDPPLIQAARAAIQAGAQVVLDEQRLLVEERNHWQPESWLLQRTCETLADAGYGAEALAVANRLVTRRPLARLQTAYRLARQLTKKPALGPLIQHELQQWQYRLFHTHREEAKDVERLLLVATTAALAAEAALAAACLERLDNLAKGWQRIVARPELRDQLALAIVHVGPHPLTNDLINIAIRRFDDAGAQLLAAITTQLQTEMVRLKQEEQVGQPRDASLPTDAPERRISNPVALAKAERMMRHCLDTLRLSTLASLQSRRVAAMIFGQAGDVDEVLTQVATIESVQTARRETGYASAQEDTTLLRQVKRTSANSDVDFLVYTLRNAIAAMPLQQLRREERIALADKLALLGVQSDGWTAASAIGILVELGAVHYGIQVVEQIEPHDPSRSEALIMLVRGLLELGEKEMAAEQAQRALDWAESLEMRNPERALTWGLAELYLDHREPAIALALLSRRREPTGWRVRLQKFFGDAIDDDGLRNRRLRLQALLQLDLQTSKAAPATSLTGNAKTEPYAGAGDNSGAGNGPPSQSNSLLVPKSAEGPANELTNPAQEIVPLLRTLQRAAPRLLEGEALVHFYSDGLLRPLLQAERTEESWALLPDLRRALAAISGNKHATRIADVMALLADELPHASERQVQQNARGTIDAFLRDLWRDSTALGLWQVVHTIEGTLPVLLQLEGPGGLMALTEQLAPATDAEK